MSGLIDWELLASLQASPALAAAPMWDAFATRYDGYCRLQAHHTVAQLDAFGLGPDETLVDVGAGTGRIAVPAAARVRQVTALDTSTAMLAILTRNAAAAGASNIEARHLPWEDVVPGANLAVHDVVVASRSPAMADLARLDALARRAVYVLLFSGPSLKDFHDRLVDGIDSFPSAGPRRTAIEGHALVFNRAVAMGREARVDYVEDGFHQHYRDEDEAVADFDWLDLPAGSEDRFRRNLRPFLRPDGDGVLLQVRTRTAIVWWPKQRPAVDLKPLDHEPLDREPVDSEPVDRAALDRQPLPGRRHDP